MEKNSVFKAVREIGGVYNTIKMEKDMQDLNNIRKELDELDNELIQLLEKRMELCADVAEYKIANGRAVLDQEREKQKLDKAEELAPGEYNKRCARDLFVQIMAMSRRLQYGILSEHGMGKKMPLEPVPMLHKENCRVVYQGVEGAYAQAAMIEYFGENVENYHVERWQDAMSDVAEGRADYGVFPIENSTAGNIADIYDLLIRYNTYIVGEQIIKVRHALLAVPGAEMKDIRTVYSHPQALAQTAGFIEKHGWKKCPLLNTAVAAQKVLEDGDKTQAAIASVYAGRIYGLEVLAEAVNDKNVNSTRFVVVSRKNIYCRDASKVSICFVLPNEEGTLYNTMSNFSYNNLNLTNIESRPFGERNWDYRFFVDFEGNLNDEAVQNALTAIESEALDFRILGNY